MTSIARERLCGHISLAMREHTIMEETFSVQSVVLRSEMLVAEDGNSSGTQR
jgi:hypothetical protein